MAKMLDRLLNMFGLDPGTALPQIRAAGEMPVFVQSDAEDPLGFGSQSPADRTARYADYEVMDSHSLVSTAIDIYRNEITQPSPQNDDRAVWIEAQDPQLRRRLEAMFEKIQLEDRLEGLARDVVKYGDLPVFPQVEGRRGIVDLLFFHPESVVPRLNDATSRIMGYECSALDVVPTTRAPDRNVGQREEGFAPWDFVWFRVGSHTMDYPMFGRSLIEAARSNWRDLMMLEVSVALYRIHTIGAHRVWTIDVGDMGPDAARQQAQLWANSLRRFQWVGPSSQVFPGSASHSSAFAEGDLASPLLYFLQRFRPYSMHEDVFWPKRRDSTSSMEFNQVAPDIKDISDIEHYTTNLRTALKVPKAYFDQDISGWQSNRALALQDIQFARQVIPGQRALIRGLTRLCMLHLIYTGYHDFHFRVKMSSPSALLEKQQLEALEDRIRAADSMIQLGDVLGVDKEDWRRWVVKRIVRLPEFGVDPDEIHDTADDPEDQGSLEAPDGDQDIPRDTQEVLTEMLIEVKRKKLGKRSPHRPSRTSARDRSKERRSGSREEAIRRAARGSLVGGDEE